MASTLALTREKRAVGRAVPILTGEIRASAVSHSSSIAMLMRAWKTLLHFTSGCDTLRFLLNNNSGHYDNNSWYCVNNSGHYDNNNGDYCDIARLLHFTSGCDMLRFMSTTVDIMTTTMDITVLLGDSYTSCDMLRFLSTTSVDITTTFQDFVKLHQWMWHSQSSESKTQQTVQQA